MKKFTERTKTHGGSRANSGRKLITKTVQKRRNITLDDDLAAFAKAYGNGNMSEGIRIALIQAALKTA